MKRNPLKELMDSEKKSLIFANAVVFIVMLISLFYLEGCGDYNIECIRTHKHRCNVLYNKNERLKYIERL